MSQVIIQLLSGEAQRSSASLDRHDDVADETYQVIILYYNTLDRFNECVIVVVTSEFSPVVAPLPTIMHPRIEIRQTRMILMSTTSLSYHPRNHDSSINTDRR